ncbi:MAG: NADH-quinone oxidoreductase subunit B family protein [Promethearchaeota archaeon]|jgi:coenzyme F420-reducing hydrogenase gamma subunit
MDVKVFQFNGCNKCFNETLLLKSESVYNVEYIKDPNEWKNEKIETAVLTGFLLPNDKELVEKIKSQSDRIIAFGSCTASGGVFALANQHGHEITPLRNIVEDIIEVEGCLGEIDELKSAIIEKEPEKLKKLCDVCSRKATCDYLDEVHRQIELENQDICFNDLGFLCNGFISRECKERCIDYNTPCRGCKQLVERSGIRMLGMFGTLMGNIEVATEHSEKGATDKLADEDDDVTRSLPDIVGNFFRFTLPTSGLPRGRIPSTGLINEDLYTGRLIEELPLITGLLGGEKSISLSLKIIETYEKANQIEVSEQTKNYRTQLMQLEEKLQTAIENEDADHYKEITEDIRHIAGNMNLSNLYFGGFKSQINDDDNFDEYKTHIFEVVEGTYKNGSVEFTIDPDGIVKEIKIREG